MRAEKFCGANYAREEGPNPEVSTSPGLRSTFVDLAGVRGLRRPPTNRNLRPIVLALLRAKGAGTPGLPRLGNQHARAERVERVGEGLAQVRVRGAGDCN